MKERDYSLYESHPHPAPMAVVNATGRDVGETRDHLPHTPFERGILRSSPGDIKT